MRLGDVSYFGTAPRTTNLYSQPMRIISGHLHGLRETRSISTCQPKSIVSSAQFASHPHRDYMVHRYHKRLLKEFRDLMSLPAPGISLVSHDDLLTEFTFRVQVDNPCYPDSDGYHLRVVIGNEYPIDSPQVMFILYTDVDSDDDLRPSIPLHPHVYSNGHICLSVLGEGWTPACSILVCVLLIQLMLLLNNTLERPPDDAAYVAHAPSNPKNTSWHYHDESV